METSDVRVTAINPMDEERAKTLFSEQLLEFSIEQKRGAVILLVIMMAFAGLFYGLLWFFVGVKILATLTLMCSVVSCILIFLLRRNWPVMPLIHVSVVLVSFLCYINALYMWPMSPIVSNYFTLIPIAALLLAGRWYAVFWAVVSVTLTMTLPILSHVLEIQAPITAEYTTLYNLGQMSTILVVILIMVLIMDRHAFERQEFMKIQRDNLNHMQTKLLQTQQFRNRFFASISHEIRTPMNAVHGIAEILSNSKHLPEEDVTLVRSLSKSSTHLLSLINDLLDLSKLEENKMQVVMTDVDVRELAYEALSIVRYAAHGKNLETRLDISSCLPKYIHSDPNRLRQVLVNLLNNAVKFTEKGHVALSCTCAMDQGQKVLRLSVEDTGIGIKSEMMGEIFTGYVQGDAAVNAQYGGTGLGLHISQRIAQLLDGQLSVVSELGKGSTFTLQMPLVASQLEWQRVQAAENPALSEAQRNTPYHILLVEDNQLNVMVAKRLIANALPNSLMTVKENGQLALDYLIEEQNLPDVILMDLQMPVMGGIEATQRIRQLERADIALIPIIAMTANASNEDRRMCIEAGMDEFVSKPLDVDSMIRKIVHVTHPTQ